MWALDALRSRSLSQRRALSEIPSLVVPLLQRIAAGETLTAEFHAEVAAADEVVRNYLRGDVPFHSGFLSAVSEARRRGGLGAVDRKRGDSPDNVGWLGRAIGRAVDDGRDHRGDDTVPASLARCNDDSPDPRTGLRSSVRVRSPRSPPEGTGLETAPTRHADRRILLALLGMILSSTARR